MDYKFIIDISRKNRKMFEQFLNTYSTAQLNAVPQGFNNSIVWNIAHTIATQQLLVYGLSNQAFLIPEDFINKFRKGTKHEKDLSATEIDDVKNLLFTTINQTEADYKAGVFKSFNHYTTSTNTTLTSVEEAMAFNNFHEGIHLGYILALKKSV